VFLLEEINDDDGVLGLSTTRALLTARRAFQVFQHF